MTIETADTLVKTLKELNRIPEGKERDNAINAIKDNILSNMSETLVAYSIIGDYIGWDSVKRIFKDSLKFVDKLEKGEDA